MKRSSIALIILILLGVLGYVVVRYYPRLIPLTFRGAITPIAPAEEQISPPVLVPTLQPTAAAPQEIPPPAYIPTLDEIRNLVISDTPATLALINDWSASVTLDFDGLKITIPSGRTETRDFPPGEYHYTVSTTDCGSAQSDSISLEKSQTYSIHFYCSSTGMFADPMGSGFATFTVHNNSDQVIAFEIGNHSYQVPPGPLEIHLAPGTYTYTASAPGVMLPAVGTVTLFTDGFSSVTFSIN